MERPLTSNGVSGWAITVLLGLLIILLGPASGEAKASKAIGTLTVQVEGLSAGSKADITVQGKGIRYRKKVTKPGRTVLKRLRLGRYLVKAKAVSVAGTTATPNRPNQSITLSKGKPRGTAKVSYRVSPDPSDPLIASTISAGSRHSCAIRQSGQAVCWGWNEEGQLGNGTNEIFSSVPVNVQGLGDAIEISAGGYHTCAIRQSGQAVCWGSDDRGQLGIGPGSSTTVPVNVQGLGDAIEISAGDLHTCAIRQSGQAVCWGDGDFGTLGNGELSSSGVPVNVQGLGDAKVISAGSNNFGHTCAIRQSGQAVCWGFNWDGQLGDGTISTFSSVPVGVQGLGDAKMVSAAAAHTCAIRQSGQGVCWGLNNYGQLGNGRTTNSNVPINVQGLGDANEISAGVTHSCAIRQSGQAVCWGRNSFGQLGNGTSGSSTDRNVPVSVQGLGDAKMVSAGRGHTCAIRQSGQAVCWGWNNYGQLGNGRTTNSNVPVNVRPN